VTGAPPVNTALPTISGTAQHLQTLTASTGTWTGTAPITYAYQWRRCNAAGASCADIAGATASTYLVQSADIASTIRVVVTATNAYGNASATSAQTGVVTGAPPVNTALPTISGTPQDGQTLTASTGTWTGTAPISYAYQWRRCDAAGASCSDIVLAVSSTYTPGSADVGSTLRVRVTATNLYGSASATSAQTELVAPAAPINTSLPVISGTAEDGQTLSSSPGTWSGTTPMTFAYQWRRCDAAGTNCVDILGATSNTYTLVAADVGQTLRSVVTATNAAGSSSATSNETELVAPAPPVNTVPPTISGTPEHLQTLTVSDDGTWTGTAPIAFTYQWQRCDSGGSNCADIAGETGTSYTLGAADVGQTVRVVVTGTNAAGSDSAASSVSGEVAPAPPVNTVPPTISGNAQHLQTLTVSDDGTWTGTDPITFTYQWQRCDSGGSNCADISGETGSSYTLTVDDIGQTVRVVVTGTNVAGSSTAASSASDVVTPAPPVNTVPPAITGTPQDGQTLSADDGTWTGTAPISYSYQWRRCDADGSNCSDISGATNATHNVNGDDVGHALRIVVTATNAAGNASATSAATSEVTALAPSGSTPPAITGPTVEGETLTAGDGTWSGTAPFTYTYQWRRCDASGDNCSDITGATASTYEAAAADVGKTLRVVVTATNAAGSDSQTSAAVGPVTPKPPVSASPPVVTGEPRVGSTLTATPGAWTSSAPLTYEYQWLRCDASGANCVEISGATGTSYTAVAADEGHVLRVRVTASNSGGSANAQSAGTAAVAPAPTDGGSTPAAPEPAPAPAPAPTSEDLTDDPDNLASACVMLTGGVGYRRLEIPGTGSVRQRVRVDGAVSRTAPVNITVEASKLRRVVYALDGRGMTAGAARKSFLLLLRPDQLAPGKHQLVTTITPRKGAARKLTTNLSVVKCDTLLSAAQWRTTAGTGLRLRVDSRTAIKSAAFKVPASLARGLATGKPASSLRIGLPGRKRVKVELRAGKGTIAGSGTSVVVKGRNVTVNGLPSATGIVEVTLYQPRAPKGPALLGRGRKATVTARVVTSKTQNLKFAIAGKR
jgi:uncharacterized protein YukE